MIFVYKNYKIKHQCLNSIKIADILSVPNTSSFSGANKQSSKSDIFFCKSSFYLIPVSIK